MVIKINPKSFNKNYYELTAWKGQTVVCGLDEVGRGCLAGPLVTAAVILPPYTSYKGLKDSKILREREKLLAYQWIRKHCLYSIGIASHREIDQHNIWNATLIAMKKAAINLMSQSGIRPTAILVDAMPLNLSHTAYSEIPVFHFTKGEKKSSSIAAASIIAKVTRDRLMQKMGQIFPGYHFEQHKGYGTTVHQSAIEQHKRSIIHRVSFLNKSFISGESCEDKEQLSLC